MRSTPVGALQVDCFPSLKRTTYCIRLHDWSIGYFEQKIKLTVGSKFGRELRAFAVVAGPAS